MNSLHGQAIDRLAPRLAVEAIAPDGTIEAVRVEGAPGFVLGVQWHPEWRVLETSDLAAPVRRLWRRLPRARRCESKA